jgi:ketosteroid isomerase-like protein
MGRGSGAGTSAAAGGDVRAAVIELHEQHRKALLNKDVATLDRIWADDFIFINYRGQMLTRAQRLENVRSGATSFKSIQFTNEVVRPYGDAAVLIGVVTLDGQYSGEEGGGTYCFSSVCSRRGEQWQIAVLQMTKVEK